MVLMKDCKSFLVVPVSVSTISGLFCVGGGSEGDHRGV